MDDGSAILGPSATRPDDRVYVILSCDVPWSYDRQTTELIAWSTHATYHPSCAESRDLLGESPPGWKVVYRNDNTRQNTRFDNEQGNSKREDRRLGKLPLGWQQEVDHQGSLCCTTDGRATG